MTAPPSGLQMPSRMRRAVIRMVCASAEVPQFSVEYDLPTEALIASRAQLRLAVPAVSITDLLHLGIARTVAEHPLLNASYTPDGVQPHDAVHLAFIVEVDDGMLTPVISHADNRPITDLVSERQRLTRAALHRQLRPEELLDGTITVSNLGPLGVPRFTALVLPPQAAVLAVGSATPRGLLTLTLSCDHRVIDGAPAARFLANLGSRLADQDWLTCQPVTDGARK